MHRFLQILAVLIYLTAFTAALAFGSHGPVSRSLWLAAFAALWFLMARWVLSTLQKSRHRRRVGRWHLQGLCPGCGYEISFSMAVCPECGFERPNIR